MSRRPRVADADDPVQRRRGARARARRAWEGIACPSSSPSRGTWASFHRSRAGCRRRAPSPASRRPLDPDEVMTGFRVAMGCAVALRRHARSVVLREGDRGGLRSAPTAGGRPHGPHCARRPGLPGRHAVGEPTRHAGGIGRSTSSAKRDVRAARALRRASRPASRNAAAAGIPASSIGSARCSAFFNAGPVVDYATAARSTRNGTHGSSTRCLRARPPRAVTVRSGVVSTAHDEALIDRTIAAAADAMKG